MCQDSLSAFTGSDAVLDGLEVLEAALDEDHLDSDDVNVTKLTSGTKTQFHSLNLEGIPFSL